MDEDQLNALTERIIGCAYRVAEKLKYGYLEKVYENAMRVELERCGFMVEQQKRIDVRYEGVLVGDYVADLFFRDGCSWRSRRARRSTTLTARSA